MRLRVLTPTNCAVSAEVAKIVLDARGGSLCLLPHHLDLVCALAPGILHYEDTAGLQHYVGTDEGVLVKCRGDVLVTTRGAFIGGLKDLRAEVRRSFIDLDEKEQAARSALARLETGIARKFVDLQDSV